MHYLLWTVLAIAGGIFVYFLIKWKDEIDSDDQ